MNPILANLLLIKISLLHLFPIPFFKPNRRRHLVAGAKSFGSAVNYKVIMKLVGGRDGPGSKVCLFPLAYIPPPAKNKSLQSAIRERAWAGVDYR